MASITTNDQRLDAALSAIPNVVRNVLAREYLKAKRSFTVSDYEHSATALGKFAEMALRAVQHAVLAKFTPIDAEIRNFLDVCIEIERAPKSSAPESLRVILPRALGFLYTLRNKRGFGHATGGLDPRRMDVATAMRTADWILAELIASGNSVPLEDAQDLVDALAVRQLPAVWEYGAVRRVLSDGLSRGQQTLLLLYSASAEAVPVEDLAGWVEHDTVSHFQRDVIMPLHRKRFVNFDAETRTVVLSPKGSQAVQADILPNLV